MLILDIIASLKKDILQSDTVSERIAIVAKYAKRITTADRCSLFIYHKDKDQLRSIYADGINGTIALRSNAGIVGYAFHKKESVLENETSSSSIFLAAVDKKSGYRTKTVLAVPIIDSDNNRFGVIQLLNKEAGFNEIDKNNIELFSDVILEILAPKSKETKKSSVPEKSEDEKKLEKLQNNFDKYLEDKKLFFMDDGNVYYKILNMIREYYIGADKCYLLENTEKKIDIHYYSTSNGFLSLEMFVKIEENIDGVLISKIESNQKYSTYQLEKD